MSQEQRVFHLGQVVSKIICAFARTIDEQFNSNNRWASSEKGHRELLLDGEYYDNYCMALKLWCNYPTNTRSNSEPI